MLVIYICLTNAVIEEIEGRTVDRVELGIAGLDRALKGGLPKGNIVLVSGGAGTGKSTLCLHYLVTGARRGEKSLYVTTEQNEGALSRQADNYGLSFKKLVDEGLIRVLYVDILQEDGIIQKIRDVVKSFLPQRIVVDSLTTFSEYASSTDLARDILLRQGGVAVRNIDQVVPGVISERTMIKRMLASLITELRGFGSTVLLTSELPEKGDRLSSDGVTEFLADGVILLYYWEIGTVEERAMKIRKMRYTSHETRSLFYCIGDDGIEIKKEEL